MNKAELIDKVAAATGQSKGATREVLEQLLEAVGQSLSSGNNIELRGFGSFKVKKRQPITARNPRTGEEVMIPARFVPTFKPSRKLQVLVDGKEK